MNEKDFNVRTKVIRETFNDTRKIKFEIPETERKLPPTCYRGGDLFQSEDGSLIDLEFQMEDFTEEELIKYVELAENLYQTYQTPIYIYIICPNNVDILMKECEIKSEAEFTIKLACIKEDPCHIILNVIKNKLENGEPLDGDDLHALSLLSVMCEKEDRNYFRKEYFKIINRLGY